MKNRLLIFLIANTTLAFASFPKNLQQINGNQIFLHTPKGNIKFFSIKKSNIVSLLGKPKKIKKFYSEIDEAIVSTYIYNEAEITFDKLGYFDDFDIKNPSWGLVFNINNKLTQPFTINSDSDKLKACFPQLGTHVKNLVLWIKETDGSISFSIVGNRIKELGYFFDNS
jgi:hypothetical protein